MRSRNIIALDLILLFLVTSCSLREFYPTAGAIIGGGVGSLGGPGVAAVSAGGGALVGEKLKGNDELEEAQETITLLTHGDVEGLIKNKMGEQNSVIDGFINTVKRILMIAAGLLACYLLIPIFVAKRCAKEEAEKSITRAPFPPREPPKPKP